MLQHYKVWVNLSVYTQTKQYTPITSAIPQTGLCPECFMKLFNYATLLSLQALLSTIVQKTSGCNVDTLERLFCVLSQCVYSHRMEYDKTQLITVSLINPYIFKDTGHCW